MSASPETRRTIRRWRGPKPASISRRARSPSPRLRRNRKGMACEPINFDPLIMADGIAPTNDPILLFRSPAYAVSFAKRFSGQ